MTKGATSTSGMKRALTVRRSAQRGGDWEHYSSDMDTLSSGFGGVPMMQDSLTGFRVASVPEPGSISLLLAGVGSLLAYAWRRKMAS